MIQAPFWSQLRVQCFLQNMKTVKERNAPSENVAPASKTAVSHLSLYGQ